MAEPVYKTRDKKKSCQNLYTREKIEKGGGRTCILHDIR